MIRGFPSAALDRVLCPEDRGRLAVPDGDAAGWVRDGEATCADCGRPYEIRGGVLDLLGERTLEHAESRAEIAARALEAERSRGAPDAPLNWADEVEAPELLGMLQPLDGLTVLELGAGPGFYTRRIAERATLVVACDFSREALAVNARTLDDRANVALVRADVTRLALAPAVFDVALTTLYSNLPSAEARRASNVAVRGALRPGARYFVSAHHQDLRRRLRGRPRADHYPGSGIFYEGFTRADLARELRATFPSVRVRPMCSWVPVASRAVSVRATLSRLACRTPVLRDLSLLLIAVAQLG